MGEGTHVRKASAAKVKGGGSRGGEAIEASRVPKLQIVLVFLSFEKNTKRPLVQTAAGVSGTVALELAGTTNILIVRRIHCKIIKSRLTQQRDKDGEDQGELRNPPSLKPLVPF